MGSHQSYTKFVSENDKSCRCVEYLWISFMGVAGIAVIFIRKPNPIAFAIGAWKKMVEKPWKKPLKSGLFLLLHVVLVIATRAWAQLVAVVVMKWAWSCRGATFHCISTAPSRSRDPPKDQCRRRTSLRNRWGERDRKIYRMLRDRNRWVEVRRVGISSWKRSLVKLCQLGKDIHWLYILYKYVVMVCFLCCLPKRNRCTFWILNKLAWIQVPWF